MRILISSIVLLAALTLVPTVHAGEAKLRGGPIARILEHSADLGLTDEQTKKLEALEKDFGPGSAGAGEKVREALKDNPELRQEFKAARESGDKEKLKELVQQIREKSGAPATPGAGAMVEKRQELMKKLPEILTPAQMVKVKAIFEEQREKFKAQGGSGAKSEKGGEPDRNSPPPKVFE